MLSGLEEGVVIGPTECAYPQPCHAERYSGSNNAQETHGQVGWTKSKCPEHPLNITKKRLLGLSRNLHCFDE